MPCRTLSLADYTGPRHKRGWLGRSQPLNIHNLKPLRGFLLLLRVLEEDPEEDAHDEGVAGEDEPGLGPGGVRGLVHGGVHDGAGGEGADGGAEAVGHHHEQALGAGTDVLGGVLLHVQGTGDVEEVERETVHDATQDEEEDARHRRVTETEESEAAHPGEHRDQHHVLDAETLHRERDQEDTQGFGSLGNGDQRVGVLHGERVRESRVRGEGAEERVRVAVRDLQRGAQEHREDEEDRELRILEQRESLQAESLGETLVLLGLVDRAVRHRKGVAGQHEGQQARRDELRVAVLHRDPADVQEVGHEHRADEADGAEHPDGREFLHRVHAFHGHRIVGHGVHEGDGGHEEGDAQAVQDEQGGELDRLPGAHAVEAGPGHEDAGQAVAQGEDPLGFHLLVGDDAHQRGHEDGDDPLHGEKPFDLAPEADVAQIAAERGEVGTPDGELQEQHQDELEGYGFDFHRRV